MPNHQKIAVIGGTGKSGKYLVRQLLNKGQAVKLLVRNAAKFEDKHPLIELVQGDARNYTAVHSLIRGCQAVISNLGQPRGETRPIFSQATTHILRSMDECGVKRYILTTGLNVDTLLDKKGTRTSAATEWMRSNYAATTADKQEEWKILTASKADWTLVRLPLIELTDTSGAIATSLEDCPGEKISATDLARFLIGQLSEGPFLRNSPFLANLAGS
jgi:putative NADH-flavin reductase